MNNLTQEFLNKHSNFSKKELLLIIRNYWSHKTSKIKKSNIIKISIPHVGVIKTSGNKKEINYLIEDKKRKRKYYKKKILTKEKILF